MLGAQPIVLYKRHMPVLLVILLAKNELYLVMFVLVYCFFC